MKEVFELLEKLNIEYDKFEHEALYTIEEAKAIEYMIEGEKCKNLFLKDHKNNFFLLLINEDKKVDLKYLRKILGSGSLSFGSEEKLKELLGLERGSVTPLGIINDKDSKVQLLVDEELVGKKILMHPNINTMTIAINYDDLVKIVKYCQNDMVIVNM